MHLKIIAFTMSTTTFLGSVSALSGYDYLSLRSLDDYSWNSYEGLSARALYDTADYELVSLLAREVFDELEFQTREAGLSFSKPAVSRSGDELKKMWEVEKDKSKTAMHDNAKKGGKMLEKACKIGEACEAQYRSENNGNAANDVKFHLNIDKAKAATLQGKRPKVLDTLQPW